MLRRRLQRITISRQLATLVLVVAVPLLGAVGYAVVSARASAGVAAERTTGQLAVLTASSVQEFLAIAGTQMGVIASRPLVRSMDPAHCDPILAYANRLNRYTANITTIDPRGRTVCSALPLPAGRPAPVSDSEWFRRARSTGRFTVGEPFVGRISHRRVSVLVLPLDDGGRRIGYLTSPIDLVEFQSFFARLAARTDALVTVTTAAGVIVARSTEADRYVGERLSPELIARLHESPVVARGVDGVERIYAGVPLVGTSWIVSSGIPTSIAYGPTDRLLTTLLVVCAGLLGLALLAAVGIGRWIAGPIRALGLHAGEIAAGRRSQPTHAGPEEIVIASQRLDEMVTALQASEQRLGESLEAAGLGAWAFDVESGRVWHSLRHDQIFGHPGPVAEWTLEHAFAQVVPDDRERVRRRLAEGIESGRIEFECRIAWPDGSEHWIAIEGRADLNEGGELARMSGTVADITDRVGNDAERTRLEEELRQSQKMEAIGQLAGGVAHDFNNLLTAISGYSELALARLADGDSELRRDIEQIASAGERAAGLTRQRLMFSRRHTLQATVFDLNDAVADSETLLGRLLGSHIDILGSLTERDCTVEADRGQIEQILMNLAVNARDAMPAGGVLAIETEVVTLTDDESKRRFGAPGGDYALLRVSDTGHGMDAETRAHAFEPFFTTKPLGEGTGLGLATVFGSVRQNGGHISLASEPGAGATFEILLPLAGAFPRAAEGVPPEDTLTGDERILLVEDDAAVRELAREMLAGRGYDVITAADGNDALVLFRAHAVDVVITDMVMPKLSGKELVARLRAEQPAIAVVFVSGYAHDPTGLGGLAADEVFVQKPYSSHDLATAVRAAVGTPGPTARRSVPV